MSPGKYMIVMSKRSPVTEEVFITRFIRHVRLTDHTHTCENSPRFFCFTGCVYCKLIAFRIERVLEVLSMQCYSAK